MKEQGDYMEVDLLQLFNALWSRVWIVVLSMIVCGGIVFAATKVLITPQYSSNILMYVNNNNRNEIQQSISQADLVAAQRLVDTYKVILRTQSTLEEVIKQADLPYGPSVLNSMISSSSVNGTEVFYVEVTSPDPKESARIANVIGQVLPKRISAIVDGSSVRLVDYAKVPARPSSPNAMKNALLGALVGMVISCAAIIIKQLMNDKVTGPDYLVQNYDIPVLAVIPELTSGRSGSGYYGNRYSQAGKGQ